MLRIAVLGPLEVTRDGQRVQVPGGKTSELLVRLALEAGVPVHADRLVDDVWAGDAVNTRRNTLQSKVAKLRRALGDPSAITGGRDGYVLVVESLEVDALAALDQAAEASRLLDAGDDRDAADLSASALSLFRGDVLQSAGDGAWVDPHRARLVEARMTLVEVHFSARLRLGEVGDVVADLESAVATYPYQERLWELLIVALYRAGRQADALAAYQRVRSVLADDLGLDPGPRLHRLEQRILIQDPSLGARDRGTRPTELDAPVGNLPSMSAGLVGRDDEVAALTDLLAGSRLVEIVGPGGVGKTAVAVEVGRRMRLPDGGAGGVWLARLETTVTAHDVVDTLIAAMNVSGGEAALFERLRVEATIVILDNCEHVLDAAAELAVRLLDAAPSLRILCTSQIPLDVEGELVFDLTPLGLDDAVELFNRRASAQRVNRAAGRSDDAVLDLCRALDGLPLAIELAAARTKTLSIDDIARRLDDRFSLLNDPTSRRPERRRSLRSTIQWSYDLLFPDDQRGLWALAVFAGGAPVPAAQFVLEALDVPAEAAIDVVGRLVSRSLVIVDDADDALPGESDQARTSTVRYRLLDGIRAYALETMAAAEMSERGLAAHAAWFARAGEFSTPGVRSSRQAEHLAFARAERANIDAALAWSAVHDPSLALGIVNGFGWAWVVLGDSRGAERIVRALDRAGDSAPERDRASALLLAAWIEASTGQLAPARDHIADAAALARAVDDAELEARSWYYLAYVVSHDGEFVQALELTDRSRVVFDTMDRPWDQAANALFAARAAISAGDEERSIEAAEQVQHWVSVVDDPWLHARADAMLGELARVRRRFDEAVDHLGRAVETSRKLGFLQTEAYQMTSLGRALCQAGDYEAGVATLELGIDKAQATGDLRLVALARIHLGRVLRAVGDARARSVLESAHAWYVEAGGGEQVALGACLLAAMDALEDVAGADERLAAILDQARRRDDAPVEVFALDALARIAAAAGDLTTARELCDQADLRMDAAAHFITELDRVDARAVRGVV